MIASPPMSLFDSLKKRCGVEDLCDMALGYKEGLGQETRNALLKEFERLGESHSSDSEGMWR